MTFLYVFILSPIIIDGHKILVIIPLHGKSHWNYMKIFIYSLLNHGNEITCITSMSMGDQKPENYTEILIDPYSRQNLGKFAIVSLTTLFKTKFNELNLQ